MNLGKILRAAKVTGVQAYNEAQQEEEADEEQGGRTYLVNATAKLIGEYGAPGYCQGKISESF